MPEFTGRHRGPRVASAPSSPVASEMYYDTTANMLYWYNGSAWINATGITNVMDAKGDLITATAADTPVRKAVGADYTYLRANSSQADGLEWRTRNPGPSYSGNPVLGASGAAVVNTVEYVGIQVVDRCTITGVAYTHISGSGNARSALYDSTGARVANRTTNLAVSGLTPFGVAFDSTYAAEPGTYYMALVFSAAINKFQNNHFHAGTVAGPGAGATATSITPPSRSGISSATSMVTY